MKDKNKRNSPCPAISMPDGDVERDLSGRAIIVVVKAAVRLHWLMISLRIGQDEGLLEDGIRRCPMYRCPLDATLAAQRVLHARLDVRVDRTLVRATQIPAPYY